jgi:hypothetical protein
MATHLHAAAIGNGNNGSSNKNGMTTAAAILIGTFYLLAACYVWRDIKDLFWLNTTVDCFTMALHWVCHEASTLMDTVCKIIPC